MFMDISSYMPVEVLYGKDVLLENGNMLKALGSRCLIVTSPTGAKKSGALDDALKVLNEQGIEAEIFGEVEENPLTSTCHRAGTKAYEFKADFILGIGGGSPLDASKAIAVFATNRHMSPDDIYTAKIEKAPLPLAVVGTTAGTGSEVTAISVLTNSATGFKKGVGGKAYYARLAFCDPKYTCSMPYSVTVSTALDALAHALESILSYDANDLSDVYAYRAVELLSVGLQKLESIKSAEEIYFKTRDLLYSASLFAGLSLNLTGTSYPHTVGYVLTERFGIPHGRACAAFSPEFIERGAKAMPEKAEKIFEAANMSHADFVALIKRLAAIPELSLPRDEIDRIASRWNDGIKNFCRTPGGYTAADAKNSFMSVVKPI